jgi:hypothetical protein
LLETLTLSLLPRDTLIRAKEVASSVVAKMLEEYGFALDIDEIKSVSSSMLEYGVDEDGAITSIREAITGHVADLSSTLSSIGSIEELDYYEKDLNKLLDDYGLHNRRIEATFQYRREALIEKETYDDEDSYSPSPPTGTRNITNEEIKSMFSGLLNS